MFLVIPIGDNHLSAGRVDDNALENLDTGITGVHFERSIRDERNDNAVNALRA